MDSRGGGGGTGDFLSLKDRQLEDHLIVVDLVLFASRVSVQRTDYATKRVVVLLDLW